MTTLYFLAIPFALLLIVGFVVLLFRERKPDELDISILTFNSEMGALAPPGSSARNRDPLRPAGYPHHRDSTLPLDVLLAKDEEAARQSRLGGGD